MDSTPLLCRLARYSLRVRERSKEIGRWNIVDPKFMQSLDSRVYSELKAIAKQKGISVQN